MLLLLLLVLLLLPLLLLAKMGREIQSVAYVACEIIAIATHSGAHKVVCQAGANEWKGTEEGDSVHPGDHKQTLLSG